MEVHYNIWQLTDLVGRLCKPHTHLEVLQLSVSLGLQCIQSAHTSIKDNCLDTEACGRTRHSCRTVCQLAQQTACPKALDSPDPAAKQVSQQPCKPYDTPFGPAAGSSTLPASSIKLWSALLLLVTQMPCMHANLLNAATNPDDTGRTLLPLPPCVMQPAQHSGTACVLTALSLPPCTPTL